ncbi:MAG: ATPase [Anaerolineae bacterium]|nr:ATPase [Anaerolineae bacterium]
MINLVVSASITVGMAALVAARRVARPRMALRAVVSGFVGLNGLTLLACVAMLVSLLSAPGAALAQGSTATQGASGAALGAALATGLACIGAGIAVGIAGAAAIGGITEKPEILGRTLIFVGLAEGIAIYGLIISFMILNA